MNTTQYYLHNNFLVVQNGEWNDTFDLNGQYVNEFFDTKGYLESQNYSKLSLQRVATHLLKRHIQYDNHLRFGYVKCIIPNPKVTIEFSHDTFSDLEGVFSFYLNNKFILNYSSVDFCFLSENKYLSENEYCNMVFSRVSKETRNSLNQIINSLNTLAKYDAN